MLSRPTLEFIQSVLLSRPHGEYVDPATGQMGAMPALVFAELHAALQAALEPEVAE